MVRRGVYHCVKATKPPTYIIKDTLGEQGKFYEQELQSSVQDVFRSERVLQKKKKQVFVKQVERLQ